MHRRELLKLAPLAPLAMLPLKVEGAQAEAYEVSPKKKYIFVFSGDVHADTFKAFKDAAKDYGIDGILVAASPDAFKVYEVDAA